MLVMRPMSYHFSEHKGTLATPAPSQVKLSEAQLCPLLARLGPWEEQHMSCF